MWRWTNKGGERLEMEAEGGERGLPHTCGPSAHLPIPIARAVAASLGGMLRDSHVFLAVSNRDPEYAHSFTLQSVIHPAHIRGLFEAGAWNMSQGSTCRQAAKLMPDVPDSRSRRQPLWLLMAAATGKGTTSRGTNSSADGRRALRPAILRLPYNLDFIPSLSPRPSPYIAGPVQCSLCLWLDSCSLCTIPRRYR